MLVNEGLYCVLWRPKVWRQLYLLNLQLCTLYCNFLHVQRLCANLPAPLLVLLWFLCFWIQSLDFHWGNTFNIDQQAWITNVCKLVIFFFNPLLYFHDQITRSKRSLKNVSRMYFHPLSNSLIIGFKHPILIIDVRRCKNPACYVI